MTASYVHAESNEMHSESSHLHAREPVVTMLLIEKGIVSICMQWHA